MANHRSSLTAGSDGIRLRCEPCDWRHFMGRNPSVPAIVFAWNAHTLAPVHYRDEAERAQQLADHHDRARERAAAAAYHDADPFQ